MATIKAKELHILAIDPGDKGTGIARVQPPTRGYSDNPDPRHLKSSYEQTLSDLTIWKDETDDYHKIILSELESRYVMARGMTAPKEVKIDLVIIEDFKLQAGRAMAQTNKTMATSELIGKIEAKCDELGIKHIRQQNVVKARWSDKTMKLELSELGFPDYKFDSRHSKDAMRHLLQGYFFTYKKAVKHD